MKYLIGALIVLVLGLQYRAWLGDGGYLVTRQLEQRLADQQAQIEAQTQRNRVFREEVSTLRDSPEALEARARFDLGMIREGETFYVFVEPAP